MSRQRSAVVVGAGVAGLCCAYYLRGAVSTSSWSSPVGSGVARLGQRRLAVPSSAGPLPEPGLTLYGLRSMFDADSPLYFKPRQLLEVAPWLFRSGPIAMRVTIATASRHREPGQGVFDLVEEMAADGVEFELYRQGMIVAAETPTMAAPNSQAHPNASARL